MWRTIYGWWLDNRERFGVAFLLLNLLMPLIVGLFIWAGWVSFSGRGLGTDCGMGALKWDC